MGDVGSLGQYKVVVTADYSQLQSQFKAMSDYIADMTKSITSNLNTSMISGFTDMGKGVNKVMESSLNDTVKTTERKLNELKKKYEDFYKGLPKPEPLAMPSAPSPSSRGGSSSRSASTGFRDYASRVRAEAKAAEDFYKEQGKAILAAEERAIAGRTAAHKAFWQEQARQEGENRKRIATLGTQYKVAYEEANKYLQSHAKMSEAVFLRLQGRLTAISREMRDLGSSPAKLNPLEGLKYSDYESKFSKLNDLFASLKHHLTWMASAAAIGVTFGIPAKTVSTIAEVEKQMAQMKQVNHEVHSDQVVYNQTMQEFIGIAEKYGHSVDDIIKAGVLWGRAYKDLNTVMKLTNLSAKLAVADNMNVDLANRAIESVVNAYQKQGEAIQFATHVVDSWTKVAHNAQSSATDLAEALSRTGAAAKAVGVDFDTTTALASTMIKATGRSGAEVGNALKSLFSSIHSDKAVKQLEALGIQMYEVDANGQKHFRNLHQVFMDLMITSHTTSQNMEKDLLAISGGKFQWSKVASVLGSYKDFIHAYGLSVNSANFSQGQIADQLDTIDRRLQQLKATFTSVATGVGSSGLSKFIKDTLVNINALVQAFQRVPSGVYSAIATMIKWGTLLVGTVGTLSLVAKGIVGMQMALKAATTAQAAETLATNVSTASKVKNLAMRVLGVNAMRAQATASVAATAGLVAEGAAAQGAAVATGELATGVTVATAGLNLLIAALAVAVLGFMGYTSIMGSAIQKQDELAQKQKDDITAKEQQIGALERENEWIGVLCENHGKLQKALDETKEGTEQHTKAEEDLKATDQELAEVIGEDAASNIDWSKGWQAVMEEEKGKHNQKIQAMRNDLVAAKEAQLAYTQNQINWTKDRIKALENEGNSWVALKNVIESFVHMLGSALIKIADFAETARNAIKDVPALGKIVGFFGGDINTLGSGAISGARDKGAAMQGWKAPDMLVNGFNYALSVTPGIQIPWLANKIRDLKRENELEYQKGDLERLEKQYNEEKADWLGAKINSYKNGTDSGIVPENEEKGGGRGKGAGAGKGRGGQEADNSDEAMGYRYLLGKGLDKNFIFGLLANINNESSFNPDADNGSHRGLIQWDYDDSSRTGRWYDFMDDYLLTMRKISEEEYNAMDKNQKRALQYDFIIYEMRRGKEQEAYQRIIDAVPTTPEQYAHLINRHYERSGEYSGGTDWARQKDARAYAERFGRKNGELNYSDGEKAIADNYKQAKKLYEDKLKDLELERSKEGQKVSAREKRNLYESMMGIGKDGNPFAVLQDATNDYKKLLVDEAKEIAKGQEYAKKSAETQAQAVEKMADAEVAFAEKLGLLNKSDVRKYEWDKNESNYAKNKPLADARLGATVALDRGTAEDMLEAYQNYVYAKDELEAEFYAKRMFYLSSDVEATRKALDEEFKLEQSYRDKRRSLNEEEFAYRARYVTTFIDSLTNGIQEGLEGILNRTKSFADAFRDIFKGVVQDIIKLFSKDFAERIHKWLSKAIFKQKETGNPAGSFADLGGILGGGKKTSGKSVGGGGAFDIVGWAQSSLSSLGGGMGKGKGKGNVLINALGLNNFASSVKSAVQPGLLMLRNQAQLTVQGISNVSQQGMQMMYTGLQTGTQMMGVTYQGYKVTQVATEQMGNAAIVADSQATAASVQATTAQMMGWIMAVLALFSLFGGGGGGSSTETSTSSVNLGRSPDSYYMTPTPVMQSTTFNVPSFDIGGNIERDMFAMVHKGEMVLTPEQADVIRNTARTNSNGSMGGGANANIKSNVTVSTVDSRGFERVLNDYNRQLSKNVKKGIRNGYLNAKGLM